MFLIPSKWAFFSPFKKVPGDWIVFSCEEQKPQIKGSLQNEKLPEGHVVCIPFIMLKSRQNKAICCLDVSLYVTKLHTHTHTHTCTQIINVEFRAVLWDGQGRNNNW